MPNLLQRIWINYLIWKCERSHRRWDKAKRGIIMEDEKEEPYYRAVSTAIAAIREQICANNGGQIVYLMIERETNNDKV